MTITKDKWPGFIPGHRKGQKMKIKLLRGTAIGGKVVQPGKRPIEVREDEARLLINYGIAEQVVPTENREADIKTVKR
jgi:hypothetical protein